MSRFFHNLFPSSCVALTALVLLGAGASVGQAAPKVTYRSLHTAKAVKPQPVNTLRPVSPINLRALNPQPLPPEPPPEKMLRLGSSINLRALNPQPLPPGPPPDAGLRPSINLRALSTLQRPR